MPERVLRIIERSAHGFSCLPCQRVSLDVEPFREYLDSEEHPAEAPFESPALKTGKKAVTELRLGCTRSILRYFLDGSRRVQRVADLLVRGRYLPLVAAQIGVAVLERHPKSRSLKPLGDFCHLKNVLAFPDLIGDDDLAFLEQRINEGRRLAFELTRYTVKKDRDPVDLAIAKVMSLMHDLEIHTVECMADRRLLTNTSLLVIDGPLRFKKKLDVTQFRNVVGLSKSFRPSFTVGKGRARTDVGALASGLAFGERTSVFRTDDGEKVIGMWYLRLRPPERMMNPLQGVVKLECYAAFPEERECGLEADRVDVISSHVLAERNVTPYGTDSRWAAHIYPIYLAETYLKASFLSDTVFGGLF